MTNQSNPEPEPRRAISKTGYSGLRSPLAGDLNLSIVISITIMGLTWLNVGRIRNSIGTIYVFTELKLLPLSLFQLIHFVNNAI